MNECQRTLLVDIALGIHTGEDTGATDRHIGVFLCDKNSRTDGVIAAAGGIRAENADKHRNTKLRELRIAIERRASATTAGKQELLLVKLNAGAVEQII